MRQVILKGVLCVAVLDFLTFFVVQPVFGQAYCDDQRVLDLFRCQAEEDPVIPGEYHCVYNNQGQGTWGCNTDPGVCATYGNICSSNDAPDCNDSLLGNSPPCQMPPNSCSPATCWVNPTPTPVPPTATPTPPGGCGGPCPTSPPPTGAPTPTPTPAGGTISGQAYCSQNSSVPVPYAKVGVVDSAPTPDWLATTHAGSSGAFSVTFNTLFSEFALRAGEDTPAPENWYGYTGTGTENICTGAGFLVWHERCPMSGVRNQSIPGFDFSQSCATLSGTLTCNEAGVVGATVGVKDGGGNWRFDTTDLGGNYSILFGTGHEEYAIRAGDRAGCDTPPCGMDSGVYVASASKPSQCDFSAPGSSYEHCDYATVVGSGASGFDFESTGPCPTAVPTPTLAPTPTPVLVSVTGRVHLDPNKFSNGSGAKCTGPDNPENPGGSKVIVNPDGEEGPILGGFNEGEYTVTNITQTSGKTIFLDFGGSSTYTCTCPSGCQYVNADIVTNTPDNWNFYIAPLTAWWQVLGGHIHVQGSLASWLPDTIPDTYLIQDFPGTTTPGTLTHSLPPPSFGNGAVSSQTAWNLVDDLSASGTWKYGYQRLWQLAGRPTTDLSGNSQPLCSDTDGCAFRHTGDLTFNGNWNGIGSKLTIFVDGTVTIGTNISLEPTGFLAIIVSGDIEVKETIGDNSPVANPDEGDAVLEGAFLADGSFKGCRDTDTDCSRQLVIYGSVGADIDLNGNGGVSFRRDLGEADNDKPGVEVIWNPQLLLNTPTVLREALTDWKEVAP